MKDLQYYNVEHQKQILDPAYVPVCMFSCDTPAIVMDYYKEGVQTNKPEEYFDPEVATKFLMEFTKGQAIPSALYNQAVWTKHYLEDLVALLQKGYECTPHIMLKLVNQYDKVLGLLNKQEQKTEEMHQRVQRLRSKNFELRKRVKKLEKELLDCAMECQILQDKLTADEAIHAITEDTGSLAASCDFGN